jgi:hypothetical protein
MIASGKGCSRQLSVSTWRLPGTSEYRESDRVRIADHPHRAAAHAIPLSRRSDANLNFRLSR